MSNAKTRIGIIGCGAAASFHMWGYMKDSRAQVVAVADVDEKKAKQFAKKNDIESYYANYDELLEQDQIEAVSVCTPPHTHAQIAIKAAEKGKHILCEKPMCTIVDEGKRMVETAQRTNVKLMVGFVTRFSAAFSRVKYLVKDGAIGTVSTVTATIYCDPPACEWYFDPQVVGIFLNCSCYGVDLARWFTESEIHEIYASGSAQDKARQQKYGPDYADNIKIVMRMKNGALVSSSTTFLMGIRNLYYEKIEVAGAHGILTADPIRDNTLILYSSKGSGISSPAEGFAYSKGWSWHSFTLANRFKADFETEIKHYVDCIRDNRPPLVSGEDGLAATEGCVAAMESFKTNRPVTMLERVK